ncbi:MFS transporter [Paenibacillus polymyxa]|uniref:MFS transporter n=1 Tax=Paenibacillus polymyxa TaxID=1406 RepID=UPI002AB578C6|nr:MFS transporter [Paenibacillus polymyxa]MDY8023427.1 MFS transporter [Paenibacillus polymyxa]
MSSNNSSTTAKIMSSASSRSFPWLGLLALAMTGFICIMTETIPAGLLPQISKGLYISEAMAGQLVTVYAIGSLVAAIPVAIVTRQWRRRPLLLLAICGFLVFNSVTAISSSYILTLAARLLAGVSAGVLWGMIGGYALRMVSTTLKGRGMAVAMVGTPIALAIGVPAGTFLGNLMGWRSVFGIMSLLTVILIAWVLWKVPDYPGQSSDKQASIYAVFLTPGIRPILLVVLTWMTAHNILYTYIAPFLAANGMGERVGLALAFFGIAALVGIWITGVFIDRWLRKLVLISLISFIFISIAMSFSNSNVLMIYIIVTVWGLTFGGAATLLQTALAQAAGESKVDMVMPINTTVWNLAIAGGGMAGGILLETFGAGSFSWALFILLFLALLVAWGGKKYSFPPQ